MNLDPARWRGLVAGIGLLAMAGWCGAARAAQGPTIYYLAPTLFDEFQTESMRSIEATFAALGHPVKTLDAQNRADVQLNQLDDVILLQPKAIILAAVDFDSVIPGIEKARAAGIPVLVYDRQIRGTRVDFTCVAGAVEIGRLVGSQAADLLRQRYGAVQGKVLQITGDPGDNFALDLQQGFEEVIKAHAGVQLISKAAMQWEPANAGDIAADQLLVNPDLDLIFTHAAHLAVPVVAGLEARGRAPGQVLLVSACGLPVGLDLIRKGWIQAEVEQPLYAQVHGLAMFFDKVLAGEPLAPDTCQVLGLRAELTLEEWGMNLVIPGAVITPDNVDDPRFWGNLKPPAEPVPVVR